MNSAILVFARYDSSRLPGKALRKLVGRPLLGRVLDRAQQVCGNHPVVLATSDRVIDDPLADLGKREGVIVFRGHPTDVLARCSACAGELGVQRVVRITGDSPFFDPILVSELLKLSVESQLDIATNVFPRTFPIGASIEVISTAALRHAAEIAEDPLDREHITRYFYNNSANFRIANVTANTQLDLRNVSLAVDTEGDLRRVSWMIEQMVRPPAQVSFEETLELAKAWGQTNILTD